jgi:hypothetical protein
VGPPYLLHGSALTDTGETQDSGLDHFEWICFDIEKDEGEREKMRERERRRES